MQSKSVKEVCSIEIRSGLKKFGLNPLHWRIEASSQPFHLRVIHFQDEGIQLRGRVARTQDGWDWDSITWVSA